MENLGPSTRGQKMLVVCPVLPSFDRQRDIPLPLHALRYESFHPKWSEDKEALAVSPRITISRHCQVSWVWPSCFFFFPDEMFVFLRQKPHPPRRGRVALHWAVGPRLFLQGCFPLGTKNFNRWKLLKKKNPQEVLSVDDLMFVCQIQFCWDLDFDDFLLMKHLESIPEAFTASRFCRWYIPKWGNAESHGKIGTGWLSLASSGIFLWKVKSVSFTKAALCGEWGNFHPPWEPCKASFLHSLLRASQYCDRARASTWKVELSRSEKNRLIRVTSGPGRCLKNKAVGLAG